MAPFFSALATFLRTALGMPPQQQLVPGVSRGSLAPTSPQPLHPLKSGPSTSPTHVLFRNTTDVAVKCFWIDYDGKEVSVMKETSAGILPRARAPPPMRVLKSERWPSH